ncbi:TlpA disulfide reductase family protein [Pedobacter sp. B4-66]|uniref:peroxiredoxin family protein n=1 Tax=Pedobacter sp. B4-66 TaxID=2817280 RepID=UPI001BD9B133|nr:TlpA disulfide reductase family protein [Pedobacter sp. B4-66]
MIIKTIASVLFVLFLCMFSLAEAQEVSQKKPIVICYDAEGKLASLEKLNADLATFVETHILSVTNYGKDTTVLKVVKKSREMFVQDSLAKAKRIEVMNAMIGKPAKDFTLVDLNNKKIALSNLKGKVVVVNFWFTGCPPCIEEIPELNKLATSYNKSKVKFLAITFDKEDTVRNFQKDHEFKFQILTDAKKITEDYNIMLYPTTFVIDKTGVIRSAINSDKNIGTTLKRAINTYL